MHIVSIWSVYIRNGCKHQSFGQSSDSVSASNIAEVECDRVPIRLGGEAHPSYGSTWCARGYPANTQRHAHLRMLLSNGIQVKKEETTKEKTIVDKKVWQLRNFLRQGAHGPCVDAHSS